MPASPAHRIRMVAIDIDGTLLRTDKRLSVRVRDTIQAVSRSGVRVVLATARPPRSVREIYNLLGLDTLQVNYNGALVHDPPRRRHIHHEPIKPDLARRIVAVARKADPQVVISLEILDKWYTDHVDDTLPTETSLVFTPDFIGPLESFLHVPVTKLMLLAPLPRLVRVREAVQAKFAGRIAMAVSDRHLIQIINPNADKSVGLQRVAREYDLLPQDVMAIGDAPNDVGMLSWAGLGVAVGNAWLEAQRAADVVVPANDEDGVAYALQKYVLKSR